jgi:hypothetical protein
MVETYAIEHRPRINSSVVQIDLLQKNQNRFEKEYKKCFKFQRQLNHQNQTLIFIQDITINIVFVASEDETPS